LISAGQTDSLKDCWVNLTPRNMLLHWEKILAIEGSQRLLGNRSMVVWKKFYYFIDRLFEKQTLMSYLHISCLLFNLIMYFALHLKLLFLQLYKVESTVHHFTHLPQ